MVKSKTREVLVMNKPVTSFTLIALICATTLAGTHWLTEKQIEDNRKNFALQQLAQVLPDANERIIKVHPNSTVYSSQLESKQTGNILPLTTSQGYNGYISGWLAIDLDRHVRGIRIVQHSETPGIGDVIETTKSRWVDQFLGHGSDSAIFELKIDQGSFDQVSGATITTRALTRAIGKTLTNAPQSLAASPVVVETADD
jgi:electron transport complex protein RnfG